MKKVLPMSGEDLATDREIADRGGHVRERHVDRHKLRSLTFERAQSLFAGLSNLPRGARPLGLGHADTQPFDARAEARPKAARARLSSPQRRWIESVWRRRDRVEKVGELPGGRSDGPDVSDGTAQTAGAADATKGGFETEKAVERSRNAYRPTAVGTDA